MLALAGNASAEDDVPGWIEAAVSEHTPVLAGIVGLSRPPFVELHYTRGNVPEGVRIIDAQAEPEKVVVRLVGAWQDQTAPAKRQLVRNLAHEVAHVWQYSIGFPGEEAFFHEGFAEAIAYDALTECGAACGQADQGLHRLHQTDCATAMKEGALAGSTSRAAVYGCGAVFTHTSADVSDLSAQDLYRRFAATGRTQADFLALVEESAGKPFALSARTFLLGDHSLARPGRVMERLRDARL